MKWLLVAGTTEKAVNKALKLIKVEYEILTPVLDFRNAKDYPVLVHPEEDWVSMMPVGADNRRNLCAADGYTDGDVEAVLADCAYVVEGTYHTLANNQAMMEPFCDKYRPGCLRPSGGDQRDPDSVSGPPDCCPGPWNIKSQCPCD